MAQYSAYPHYSPDGAPVAWEKKRLRFALKMNPSKNEMKLDDSDLVSFVPMDTPADQLFFDQVRETAVANEQVQQAVKANSIENFGPVLNRLFDSLVIERMEGNEEITVRLMNDQALRDVVVSHLVRAVYQQIKSAEN